MDDKIQQLIDEFWKAWDNLLDNGVEIVDSRSFEPISHDDISFNYEEDEGE